MWKSKELSDESIKYPTASNDSINWALHDINMKSQVRFDGTFLRQDKLTFTH